MAVSISGVDSNGGLVYFLSDKVYRVPARTGSAVAQDYSSKTYTYERKDYNTGLVTKVSVMILKV